MNGGLSIIFTRRAVVDQTYIRNSSIVGYDTSQLYPFTMCQEMPTRFYTRWEYDSETDCLKTRKSRTRILENMVMSLYQELRPECKTESFYTNGKQKKIECFHVHGHCDHCKHYLKLWLATITSAHAKKPV